MTQLSVNINKLATLRNARGQNQPHLVSFTKDIIRFGAQGITLHPRPDERHIKKTDVFEIQELIQMKKKESNPELEYNIEGYPSEDFLDLVLKTKANQITLVPDPPEALTSNAGWDFHTHKDFLYEVTQSLSDKGFRVSLFLDPSTFNEDHAKALSIIQPHRIELYTEAYAKAFEKNNPEESLKPYQNASLIAKELKIDVNAGHDLSQNNLATLLKAIPFIEEVSIGHALICESLYLGLERTIKNYLQIINEVYKK